MAARWMTKYGPRRVRVEPPTLEEALYAASGLSEEPAEQVQIAADLMGVPVDEVKQQAERFLRSRTGRVQVVHSQNARGPIVVERKVTRRVVARSAVR